LTKKAESKLKLERRLGGREGGEGEAGWRRGQGNTN